ncbi:hypothetical protein B0H63DRAFT_224905 [Podospora didyma]|uniref:Chromo domain-containing protein n=1 Tax=Podospora didyma TaxID=330526 RepID=A0AAE0KK75_9PEZI|nr:hypothetical protein B0H63DRAFT_224905 [Podospora didyma]
MPRATTKTSKSKRRKRAPVPKQTTDVLFLIRGIIDEKTVKGRLLYKIDWEDNPTSGEHYEPTWEPAENANETAVADWEEVKRRRQTSSVSSSEHSSVDQSNSRKRQRSTASADKDSRKKQKSSKTTPAIDDEASKATPARDDEASKKTLTRDDEPEIEPGPEPEPEPDWAFAQSEPNKQGTLVLDIKQRAGFDASEYSRIQLSQSQPSQLSQASASGGESAHPTEENGKASQTTIQDSQVFTEPLPSDLTPSAPSPRENQPLGSDFAAAAGSVVISETAQGSTQEDASQFSPQVEDGSIKGLPQNHEGILRSREDSGEGHGGILQSFGGDINSSEEFGRRSQSTHPEGPSSSSDPNIPSGQPETGLRQGLNGSFSLLEGQQGSAEHSSTNTLPGFEIASSQHSGFLTQPDFHSAFSPEDSSATRIVESAINSESLQQLGESSGRSIDTHSRANRLNKATTSPSPWSPHFAEVVLPLSSIPNPFLAQSHHSTDIKEIVLDTVEKQARKEFSPYQLTQALGQLTNRSQAFTSGLQTSGSSSRLLRHKLSPLRTRGNPNRCRPSTPQSASMDTSSVEGTPKTRSAVEEFRALRASVFDQNRDPTPPSPTSFSTSWHATSSNAAVRNLDTGAGPSTLHKEGSLSAAEEIKRAIGLGLGDVSSSGLSILPDRRDSMTKQHIGTDQGQSADVSRFGLGLPADHTAVGGQYVTLDQGRRVDSSAAGLNLSSGHLNPLFGEHMSYKSVPTTVAPSDLTISFNHATSADGALPSDGQNTTVNPMSTVLINTESEIHDDLEEDKSSHHVFNEHIVTLPMAASTRNEYLSIIKENKATMIEFSDVFINLDSMPSDALTSKMDMVFQRLLDLCDLPASADRLHGMAHREMMRHATNSNCKYSFVHEFLKGIRDLNARALILSQEGHPFQYLEAVVSESGLRYTVLGQNKEPIDHIADGLTVILAVSDQDLTSIHGGIDVVVAFDHTARSITLPSTLASNDKPALVLSLLASYSLEHIDFQLGADVVGLERKNALNTATANMKPLLKNPESGQLEPYEAADFFASCMRHPQDDIHWVPLHLCDDVMDFWQSSQSRTHDSQSLTFHDSNGLTSRKRANDDTEGGALKRPRIVDVSQRARNEPPVRMSDLLTTILSSYASPGKIPSQSVEVSVEQLEKMAAKIATLEDRLRAQDSVEARDRGTFQAESTKAKRVADKVTKQLEAKTSELESLKDQIRALQSKPTDPNTALATNSADSEAGGLATLQKSREETQAKANSLEKKLGIAQKELEYTREVYQIASKSFTELQTENQELKTKMGGLEKKAGDNLLKIHQLNSQTEAEAIQKRVDEFQAIIRDLQRDLDRARDELRHYKSGRRETRQASVPRSPRTGVLSPRPSRAVASSTGSRGTSPAPVDGNAAGSTGVPGMTFFSQPPGNNGRWGHLRD